MHVGIGGWISWGAANLDPCPNLSPQYHGSRMIRCNEKKNNKKRFLISVFSNIYILQYSKWDCQVLQEHPFSSKTQSIRKMLSWYLFVRRPSVQLGKVIWRGQEVVTNLADPWGASVRSYSKISLGSWIIQLHVDSHPSIYSGVQTRSQVLLIHKAFLLLWAWSGTLHDALKCNRFKKQNKPRQ